MYARRKTEKITRPVTRDFYPGRKMTRRSINTEFYGVSYQL